MAVGISYAPGTVRNTFLEVTLAIGIASLTDGETEAQRAKVPCLDPTLAVNLI